MNKPVIHRKPPTKQVDFFADDDDDASNTSAFIPKPKPV
jgi:hypothetical protein